MPISLRYPFDPLPLSQIVQNIFTKLPLNLTKMPHRRVLLYNCSKEPKTLHFCVMCSLKISNSAQNYEEASTDACFSANLMNLNRLHACITPNFLLLCCVNFRNVLYAHWPSTNKTISFSVVILSSSGSTRFLLHNMSSEFSSEEISQPVSSHLLASREFDSSISLHPFLCTQRFQDFEQLNII